MLLQLSDREIAIWSINGLKFSFKFEKTKKHFKQELKILEVYKTSRALLQSEHNRTTVYVNIYYYSVNK
jgi:hypothetical protein